MSVRTVHVFESSQSLGAFACELVAEHARRAIHERGSFTLALSGGSQPQMLAALAAEPLRSSIEWHKCFILWVDERCVPLSHADSNYAQAHRHVLSHVPQLAGSANVVALDETLAESPHEAALAYERALRAVCTNIDPSTGVPQVDLVLLGIGEDGHTASLFPGHALLEHTDGAIVLAITDSPKPPPSRITFSLPLINAARCAAFLATGAGKADVLAAAFERREPLLPIARVASAHVYWLLDRAAAANVPAADVTPLPAASGAHCSL